MYSTLFKWLAIQMPCTWYHLNNEQVKVYYSDASTIQIPNVHQNQIPTVRTPLHVPLSSARTPTSYIHPLFFSTLNLLQANVLPQPIQRLMELLPVVTSCLLVFSYSNFQL